MIAGAKIGPPTKGRKKRPSALLKFLISLLRLGKTVVDGLNDEMRGAARKGRGGGLGGGSGQGGPRSAQRDGRGRGGRSGWNPRDRDPFDRDQLEMDAELYGATRTPWGGWVGPDGQPIRDIGAWVAEQVEADGPQAPGADPDAPAWQQYGFPSPDDFDRQAEGWDAGREGGPQVDVDSEGDDGGSADGGEPA